MKPKSSGLYPELDKTVANEMAKLVRDFVEVIKSYKNKKQ